jgi:hypothetical protein
MIEQLLPLLIALPLAFSSFSALAQDVIKGRIQAIDRKARKVTIRGIDYILGPEAIRGQIAVGDDVEAVVMSGTIRGIVKR